MPEIMDGKNVMDFIDADVLAKLDALEAEHEQVEAELASSGAAADADDGLALDADEVALLRAVRERKTILRERAHLRSKHRAPLPAKARARGRRDAREIGEHLEAFGVPRAVTAAIEARGRKRERSLGPRGADGADDGGDAMMDDAPDGAGARGDAAPAAKQARGRAASRGRSAVARGADGEASPSRERSQRRSVSVAAAARAKESEQRRALAAVGGAEGKAKAEKVQRKQQRARNNLARAGASDRKAGPKLLKHLLAGKMGLGTSRSR